MFNLSQKIGSFFFRGKTLFDENFYMQRYPDVAKSGMKPFKHYINHGVDEGRFANLLFDTSYYLKQTTDRPRDPTNHYILYGAALGLDPHPEFHTGYYLRNYPDVRNLKLNPLHHFLTFGRFEGRKGAPLYAGIFEGGPWLEWPSNNFPTKNTLIFEPPGPSADFNSFSKSFALICHLNDVERHSFIASLDLSCFSSKTVTLNLEPTGFSNKDFNFILKASHCYLQFKENTIRVKYAEALAFGIKNERLLYLQGYPPGLICIQNSDAIIKHGPKIVF